MNAVFADTFYYLALVNRDDAVHSRAIVFARDLHVPVLTTAWVITEVADALAS
jgi:predicted nucleic acid-binding protein